MRPITLTISAFGPYAQVETIDFTKLKSNNIFLITGPTGAGKTTIFDAISYALFGEASGTSRDKDGLRSDFADDSMPTFVDFQFKLNEQVYRVIRYPQQERKKVRGEGFALKAAEAELILPTGKVITKISAVDEKITSLIGINKTQFRQIVMLPQGEFRKLLDCDSSERETIFRKIFSTEDFEVIQKKLDEESKTLYRKIADIKKERDTYIKHISAGDDESLNNLLQSDNFNVPEIVERLKYAISHDKDSFSDVEKQINGLKLKQENLQKSIISGEETNKKIRNLDNLSYSYNELIEKGQIFVDKSTHLQLARKALNVTAIDKTLSEKKEELYLKRIQYKQALDNFNKINDDILIAKKNLKLEESKEDYRKELSDKIALLKSYEENIKSYENELSTINIMEKELTLKQNNISDLKLKIKNNKEALDDYSKKLSAAQKASAEKEKIDRMAFEVKTIIDNLLSLHKLLTQYVNAKNNYNSSTKDFNQFEHRYLSKKKQYEFMDDSYRKGQAGILASRLMPQEPCPVCGSLEHPSPAALIDGIPSEDDLKKLKAEYELLKNERDDKLKFLADLNGSITNMKSSICEKLENLNDYLADCNKLDEPEQLLETIVATGKKLREHLNELSINQKQLLNVINSIAGIQKSIESLNNLVKQHEDTVTNFEAEYTDFFAKVQSKKEFISRIENEIPPDIRSTSQLTKKLCVIDSEVDALDKSYKLAQKRFNDLEKDLTACTTDINLKKQNISELEESILKYEKLLKEALLSAGFKDYAEYTKLKLSETEIQQLDSEINSYYQNVKSLKDRLNDAQKDCKGLSVIDINTFSDELNVIKLNETKLEQLSKEIFARIDSNKRCLAAITNLSTKIEKEEDRFNIIGDLAYAANGFNAERITFERYVLAAYFDEIISAANIRLYKMSSGRFLLYRKREKGKGKKQEGLELEVYDNYTGKFRHVKTLSGGESFKASLSLALGLADIIQSYSGGINLDTIFLDEGFGTLDSESLDSAIQCLMELQNDGRLVGIISHVDELKERINARLEINPTKDGSKTKFVI
ncbi:AAA family ATPase [Clostridium oryzae]|uniref:Nuclease SbcCD subunit C n=1 Tax=Clostridium oryzae TaxID=1450648 RepID=A0A1V4IKC4_9CLOT|nr:AAA family ATPase [Clostridium oryzae]OPJ60482.1 nuclease SbcCD subunit C [Clostridium oryzae]